jgi:hypothetical protein
MYFRKGGVDKWYYATSPDAITWDLHEDVVVDLRNDGQTIQFDGDYFWALCNNAPDEDYPILWGSVDGIHWKEVATTSLLPWQAWQDSQGYDFHFVDKEAGVFRNFFSSNLGAYSAVGFGVLPYTPLDAVGGIATLKTIRIPIPGYGCFSISIDNPGPYDVTLSQSVDWTQEAPSDVQTILLNGTITVLAGQSESVTLPCFDVGSGATPGEYPLDIVWTGSNSHGDPVEFNTDPSIILFSPGGAGAVGGTASMANKIELLAPWIALVTLILLTIGVVASRRFGKKFKK